MGRWRQILIGKIGGYFVPIDGELKAHHFYVIDYRDKIMEGCKKAR